MTPSLNRFTLAIFKLISPVDRVAGSCHHRRCVRSLQIVAASIATATAAASMAVTGEGEERIRWFFELDRWMTTQFVAVAPPGTPAAGTIYTSDNLGLYAINPNGTLQWFVPGAGGGYAIDIGADGTIYTGTTLSFETAGNVVALNPDGSLRWEFVPPDTRSNLFLTTGPNVGPDGNIYAVQNPLRDEGLGFFSLDPEGNLRWSNTTTQTLALLSSHRSEIAIASDRLYAGVVNVGSGGQPFVFAFDFNGNQLWYTGQFPPPHLQSYPRVDPFDRAVGVWGQTGLTALNPKGAQAWFTVHPSQVNVGHLPTIDSKGNIYAGASGSRMWAVNPQGQILWVLPNIPVTNLTKTGISPDDAVIVAHHSRQSQPTAITGHDPAEGEFLWLVELPHPQVPVQLVTSLYPRFSADSETAYITTSSGGPSVNYSRLYAIDITKEGPQPPTPADITGDGVVDVDDLIAVILAWGDCADCGNCPADLDNDCAVDVDDLVAVILNWG